MDDDYQLDDPGEWNPPSWDTPGTCVCGAEIPPMSQWDNPGGQWSSVSCVGCGAFLVDEEDFVMVHPDGAPE